MWNFSDDVEYGYDFCEIFYKGVSQNVLNKQRLNLIPPLLHWGTVPNTPKSNSKRLVLL